MFVDLLTYLAILLLTIGLYLSYRAKHKQKEKLFLIGTALLLIGASLNWLSIGTLELLAFVLLFALQVISNILQMKIKKESFNTKVLLLLSVALFLFFFFSGLFYNNYFFIIAFGTVLAAFGYKEPAKHAIKQAGFFMVAALLESIFAILTDQFIYVILNIPFIIFALLIIIKGSKRK